MKYFEAKNTSRGIFYRYLVNIYRNLKRYFCLPIYIRDFIYLKIILGIGYKKSWRFYGIPYINNAKKKGKIEIGEYFIATSKIKFNSIGVFQPVIIKVFPNAKLVIGDNVGVSGSAISCSNNIIIGNNVLIGSGCLITDSDAHPILYKERHLSEKIVTKPIVIEDNVFIGARSIVLKGVTIGNGAVIGAGSVVACNIPENSIAAGNPAKVIRIISN